MKTYTERATRAYMAGQTELADLFDELTRLEARADGLGDLLADLIAHIEWNHPETARAWTHDHQGALDALLE